MIVDTTKLLSEIRTKCNERIRLASNDGSITEGESFLSDEELLIIAQKELNQLYFQAVETVPQMFVKTRKIIPDDIVLDPEDEGFFYVSVPDIWKIINLYLVYDSGGGNRFWLDEGRYEDLAIHISTLSSVAESDELIGKKAIYYFEGKKIYLPYDNEKYILKYAAEEYPIETADIPRIFYDYIVIASACEVKISGQEMTLDSPHIVDRNKLYNDLQTFLNNSRNKSSSIKIRKNNSGLALL